jgi:hypothetical protein
MILIVEQVRGIIMKKLLFPLLVLGFICHYTIAEGDEWIYLRTDNLDNKHYYSKKIVHSSREIVGVRLRINYSKQGKSSFIIDLSETGISAPDLSELGYTIGFYKINCIRRQSTCKSVAVYSRKGKILGKQKYPDQWMLIDKGSLMDATYKTLCRKRKKR